MMDSGDIFRLLIVGVLIVIFAYATVRGMSFAYFRTKLEHWRTVMKEMKDGEK